MIDEVSPGTVWNMNYEGTLESGETIPYTIRKKSDGTIIHSGVITIK